MKKGIVQNLKIIASAMLGSVVMNEAASEKGEPREPYVENRHRNIPLTKKQSRARAASKRARKARKIEFLNRK